MVTAVSQARVPSADVIQGLFDLTVAEARVAKSVAEGKSLEQLAIETGVALGTVRSQLKSVFTKTGLCRQGDLSRLLGRLAFPDSE